MPGEEKIQPPKEEEGEKLGLKKSINLLSGITIIIGTIAGGGIFITANSVLENAGTPGLSLGVWLFSGLVSLTGAICFSELGTLLPASGGIYTYINESFGHMAAFLYVWMMVFVCLPSLNAVSSITLSMYLVQLFFPSCVAPFLVTRIIAGLFLCMLFSSL